MKVRARDKRLSTTIICTDATSTPAGPRSQDVEPAINLPPRPDDASFARPMRLPCKSAAEALADCPISGLLDQARRLDRITAVVEEISRELTNTPAPLPATRCTLQGCTVIIGVGTPSQAAKLRQCEARILQALRERVPEVTGIRIRLQPGKANYPMSGIEQTQEIAMPCEGAERLPDPQAVIRFADDLASTLHDSPLRESARRLQATLRRKLTRDR